MSLSFSLAKDSFFDSPKVMAAVGKAERRFHMQAGGYVRTVARRSIRSRKKSAQPGTPPSSHKGTLKNLIFFAYDTQQAKTVVGPVLFGANVTGQRPRAPRTLETGATVTRTVFAPVDPKTKRRRAKPNQAAAYRKLLNQGRLTEARRPVAEPRAETVKYRDFPFMKPALLVAVQAGVLPQAFAGQLGR